MNSLTGKQALYLLLALAGAAGTWYFNLQMTDLSQFFSAVWDTPLSSSLSMDLLVSLLTYVVFMWPEGRRLGMSPWLLVAILLSAGLVAFAFSFPLFMFFRERALARAG
jgi:hypothetical protein